MKIRGVAQFGSAPLWGSGGRGFKSRRSDYLSSSFISDLYSLYELMPTAMNVKEEKKVKTNMVRFETSTSPNWKDIKIFIRDNFFKTLTQLQKFFFHSIINSKELQHQKLLDR